MITCQNYRVADPDALETPAMLLFQDIMDQNIRSVCEMVGGAQNLIAHVKTHKSEAVTRRQVEAGINGFKCATLKELEMVLQVIIPPQGLFDFIISIHYNFHRDAFLTNRVFFRFGH